MHNNPSNTLLKHGYAVWQHTHMHRLMCYKHQNVSNMQLEVYSSSRLIMWTCMNCDIILKCLKRVRIELRKVRFTTCCMSGRVIIGALCQVWKKIEKFHILRKKWQIWWQKLQKNCFFSLYDKKCEIKCIS